MYFINKRYWQTGLLLILSVLSLAATAKEKPFTLQLLAGEAVITNSQGQQRAANNGDTIKPGETVKVAANGSVAITQEQQVNLVLDENTEMEIKKGGVLSQLTGLVFYWFAKSNAVRSVETNGTTIGIRGTEFLIKSNSTAYELTLAEGAVDITAQEAEFAHYKAQVLSEFEAYKRQQLQEFEAFKQQQQDYLGQHKTVAVKAGTSITISSEQRLVEQTAFSSALERIEQLKQRLH